MKKLITIIISSFLLLKISPTPTLASCDNFTDCLQGIGVPGVVDTKFAPTGSGTFVSTLVGLIIPIALGIGGMLTVVFIIISGIQFITSGGDPKGAAAAKDRLVYAIIGFIVLALAFAVLQIIDRLFLGTVIT